ncbi:MAG: hypothetical protein M1831_004689 [Alyxoria varia]|nr:MAG: hypothetical protein M1831_004689 [Alyxoria varia]
MASGLQFILESPGPHKDGGLVYIMRHPEVKEPKFVWHHPDGKKWSLCERTDCKAFDRLADEENKKPGGLMIEHYMRYPPGFGYITVKEDGLEYSKDPSPNSPSYAKCGRTSAMTDQVFCKFEAARGEAEFEQETCGAGVWELIPWDSTTMI